MPKKEEIIAASLKGAVAGFPFVGGVIAELGDLFLIQFKKDEINGVVKFRTP